MLGEQLVADLERLMGTRSSSRAGTKPTNPKDRAATTRLDLSLFPDTAVAFGALAFTEGDAKYGAFNWRVAGVSVSVYIAAVRRHLAKYYNGQWADSHTGVPHLASAIADIAVIIDAYACGKLNDDRPPKADLTKVLAAFETNVLRVHTLYPNGPPRNVQAVIEEIA